MASAGRIETLLTCAKAQERRAMLPDGFSIGYFRLGTRLEVFIAWVEGCRVGAKSATACIMSLCVAGEIQILILGFQPRPSNHQIKIPAKFSGYTVFTALSASIRIEV